MKPKLKEARRCTICGKPSQWSVCAACYSFDLYHRNMDHGPLYFNTIFKERVERATARLAWVTKHKKLRLVK